MRNCRTTEEPGRGAGFGRLVGPRRGAGERRHNPAPNKFRMQFDEKNFQQTQKTLQFQRCKFNI